MSFFYTDDLHINGTTVTATGDELNILDGNTSVGTTTVASGDGIVTNDGGTMRQTNVDTFDTYFSGTTKTLTNKTLTAPKFADAGYIADSNGNELIVFQVTGSAVNALEITNSSAGGNVVIGSTGDDSNIDITITPKGTGEVNIAAGNLNYAETAVTATGAELNILDGNTSAISTTIADADRVVVNDAGTMKQVAVTDLAAYFDDEITAMPNLVTTAATTVGILNSGSIASNFGNIDNGSSTITTTGAITGGTMNNLYVKSNDLNFTHSILIQTGEISHGTLNTAENNIGIGNSVFLILTSGDNNVGVGVEALKGITYGSSNTAIGYQSSSGVNPQRCVSIGYKSLTNGQYTFDNVAIGYESLSSTSGTSSEWVLGSYNTAVGKYSIKYNTTGYYNVGIGLNTIYQTTTGYRNTAIGSKAGTVNTTGCDNICIGYNANVSANNRTNEIVIGYNAIGKGNSTAVIGNGSLDKVYMNHSGTATIYAAATPSVSDSRIKNNIIDIDDSSALQYVRDIPCRYYTYLDTARRGTDQTPGFIAQEVEAVFPLAVSTDTNYIPNEYRLLTNYTLTETTTPIDTENISKGNYWKLTINDLTDLSTTNKYRFIFSNVTVFDYSNVKNLERDLKSIDGEPTSFLLEEQWTHIFFYGKEVSDFKRIDKAKIFTLHHSAIQQIDATLTAQQAKITTLETELAAIKTHLGL